MTTGDSETNDNANELSSGLVYYLEVNKLVVYQGERIYEVKFDNS